MALGLNLPALHYFFWFSALTSIYGYISVYAKHYANTSASQYGLLNMILPFVTILSKLFFCSLADRYQAHRSFFILALTAALIGYGSFGVLPFFIAPQPEQNGLNLGIWVLICIMTSLATIAMSVVSCLSDAFAMNSAKKYKISYGMIRLWGTIGWGLSGMLISYINSTNGLPFLVPGLIMTIVLISLDIFTVIIWPDRSDFNLDKSCSDVNFEDVVTVLSREAKISTKQGQNYGTSESVRCRNINQTESNTEQVDDFSSFKIQWMVFREVATRRRSIFRYMTLFTISGILISLQWSYFFLYLEKIYTQDFSYISGLSMVGQSLLGELPFFILSNYVIKIMGRPYALSLSIMSIGLRYLLYQYLLPNVSMYYVLLTETFQGPNFGLFYVILTEVGLDYSDCEGAILSIVEKGRIANKPDQIEKLRQTLRATMQSLMSACYEGLGVGIGSVVGGFVIEYYDFEILWLYSAIVAMALGLVNIVIELLDLECLADKQSQLIPVNNR